ncbi:hypothetical protein C8J56DRAFT_3184 [Mycena floridula]|nr:hypothetical protein C8J56DRAFT_3184 [Mycena floridula]
MHFLLIVRLALSLFLVPRYSLKLKTSLIRDSLFFIILRRFVYMPRRRVSITCLLYGASYYAVFYTCMPHY